MDTPAETEQFVWFFFVHSVIPYIIKHVHFVFQSMRLLESLPRKNAHQHKEKLEWLISFHIYAVDILVKS